MIVYAIIHITSGMTYVGATSMTLKRRFSHHVGRAKKGSQTPLHLALIEFGANAFRLEAISSAETKETLYSMEIAEIARRGCQIPNGYNVTPGGVGQSKGYVPSSEAKKKLGESSKRSWASNTPEERAARGAAISAAKKGVKRGKNKVPSYMKGKTISQERKDKISAGMKAYISTLPDGEMGRRSKKKTRS